MPTISTLAMIFCRLARRSSSSRRLICRSCFLRAKDRSRSLLLAICASGVRTDGASAVVAETTRPSKPISQKCRRSTCAAPAGGRLV